MPGRPGDMPASSAKGQADEYIKSAAEHGLKGPSRAGPTVTPAPVGGGARTDLGRERDGVDNAEQHQLDREAAALGRQDRPELPHKPDAGGGAQLEKGTSLSDSSQSDNKHSAASASSSTQP